MNEILTNYRRSYFHIKQDNEKIFYSEDDFWNNL